MRKLVRIFMTVVAGMMAFSCATDTTDDLGVNLGKGQKTVISVSLEESRTYLGGYNEVAKKYPMYWSAGDKISANGVMSEAAVINTSNEAVASFEFSANANLTKPYFVTYPAVANAEGKWQVKFEDEQNYKYGTFDKGVSTMYGYSEESLNVQMNHLTGILKIGIVLPEGSENVTLKYAQISTVDRKPIAGTFDFAFETDAEGNKVPKLTPTADAVNVIEYIFVKDEGLPLDPNEPTYIHAAVPAGIYDELYVTLYDIDGGVMYATVKADDTKPLKAGAVREFKKDGVEQLIEYTPTADNVYIVSDAGTLAGVKNNLDKTVVMVADVDMSNESWTSIENFSGSFYGNGYAIKGLKAPLFGTTTASVIKGVHLEDVDINDSVTGTVTWYFGALACQITNTAATVEDCSVSGEMVLDMNSNGKGKHIGGIIGNCKAPISKLVNKANITITGTNKGAGYYSGIVCCTSSTVTKCQNLGTIRYSATNSDKKQIWISGIGCHSNGGITHCTNGSADSSEIGAIIFDGTSAYTTQLAGISVGAKNNASYCKNYAKIVCDGEYKPRSFIRVAGVFSLFDENVGGTISHCENYGPITLSSSIVKNSTYTGEVSVAGVICAYKDKTYTLESCANYGSISIDLSSTEDNLITNLKVGGVTECVLSNTTCNNLTNKGGNITITGTGGSQNVYIGGVAGTTDKPITNASVFCNVNAQGLSNVGMLTGSAYSATIAATGCKVGGSILMGDMAAAETLSGGNYYNYIYGSGNSADAASGCTPWDGTEE